MSCRTAPDACRPTAMDGTATLTIELSMTAISCPVRTTASTAPGRAGRGNGAVPRPGPRRMPGSDGSLSMRSVMAPSLPGALCWYQEPGYPGTDTTWKAVRVHDGGSSGEQHREQGDRAPY